MTIFELFDGLDLCAPGDAATVARACAGLAADAAVLDAGCGRGADLPALLSAVPEGRVTAVDLSEDFVAHVRARFPQVRAAARDMTDPPPGPYDLIWSNGAIYNPGVTAGLAAWRAHLAPGGRVAFTDLVLRVPAPSAPVAAFLAAEGLAPRWPGDVDAEIAAAGYRLVDRAWLPDSAWAAYYDPLERRLDAVAAQDAATAEMVAAFRAEIALWRGRGAEYGYLLSVVAPE